MLIVISNIKLLFSTCYYFADNYQILELLLYMKIKMVKLVSPTIIKDSFIFLFPAYGMSDHTLLQRSRNPNLSCPLSLSLSLKTTLYIYHHQTQTIDNTTYIFFHYLITSNPFYCGENFQNGNSFSILNFHKVFIF